MKSRASSTQHRPAYCMYQGHFAPPIAYLIKIRQPLGLKVTFLSQFNQPTAFLEQEFEHAHHMSRTEHELIREELINSTKHFRHHYDSKMRKGASTDLKITAGIHMLEEGCSAFSSVESLNVFESLIIESFKRLVYGVGGKHEAVCMHRPTVS